MIITLGTTPAVQLSMSFDAVVIDGVNRSKHTLRYASGKSINASRVLRTLGQPVHALGFAGGDSGSFLRQQLKGMGCDHTLVEVPAATRTCVTVLDRSTSAATELIEEPSSVDTTCYRQLVEVLLTHAATAQAVLLAGSLPPDAPPTFYADCVAVIPAGVFTLIDAKGPPLRHALRHRPTVVKPNRQELSETVGRAVETDAELKHAIGEMILLGPQWVVVTDGPRPTIISDGSQFFRLTAPAVKVVSAIGSGDSLAAGLVAGLCDGRSVPDACRLAAACGSANAMTDTAGGLSLADVKALEQRVELEPF